MAPFLPRMSLHRPVCLGGLLLLLLGCSTLQRVAFWQRPDFRVYHLGNPDQPEWLDLNKTPVDGRDLTHAFVLEEVSAGESTLLLWQNNVKYDWPVALNGRKLGKLQLYEIPVVTAFALPPGLLKKGENVLSITSPKENDEIQVGLLRVDPHPLRELLGQASLTLDVTESLGGYVPCRITIVDELVDALPPLAAAPGQRIAVRPGVVYSADGHARVTLPAGRYKIHAGRGVEYSIATESVSLSPGDSETVSLKIRREVPTANLVACDPHLHTLEFSGHGDATADERAITLAGEGVELPIATEHNQLNGYAAAAGRMGLLSRFTPVLGSEITTPAGHFNIFPVEPGARLPDWNVTDWPKLMESIRRTPGVKVVILNHPRNNHTNFVPFADQNFNRASGDNLRGPEFTFDAMELLNSSALRSDDFQVIRDWMALLNHGYRITGVGSSDCHDVNRFIVGQARTYLSCRDTDPGRIDVAAACESFLKGRAVVSLGLIAQIKVDGRYGPGDLVPGSGPLDIEVRVFGPSWTRVERVELFANGERIRDEWIEGGAMGGEKARLKWKIDRPSNDVHLEVVASGPGVKDLSWPLSRPYQPSTPLWNPRVISVTNPVWVDADGDGVFTSPRGLAAKVLGLHEKDLPAVIAELSHYDEAVATQAASLLRLAGTDVRTQAVQRALSAAAEPVRRGFAAYGAALTDR
ncbi:MAG TPA: CehA/McbA family metallohydrolase [Planctomycetota bacterium]|nr:CehA/McbA family metallohydrolase [Planctomycetota bacterium]